MGDYMASAFTPPMDRELSPRLNDGTFRAFIHDTHHAYLLLHRAFHVDLEVFHHCISPLSHTRTTSAFLIKLWLWVTNVTRPWRDFLGQHLTALLPIRELRDLLTPT